MKAKFSFLTLLALFTGLFYSCETDDVEPEENTPIPVASFIINEVLYDPSNTALEGDANNDGIYSQDDDSFIELYNDGPEDFDLSGFQIWDKDVQGSDSSVQFTFPDSTILAVNKAIVVFGGGTPTGAFGGATVLNAVTGLNFNNSGELILIKDSTGVVYLTFDSDALSNNPNESYTRSPDINGGFVQHNAGTTSGVLFSPGTKLDGTPF
jgi:hypothetical protein